MCKVNLLYKLKVNMDIFDNLKVIKLIETYGGLLTDKQLEICKYYFYDNLSLAEIGELLGSTRQAIHDAIIKTKKILDNYEQKIGLISKIESVKSSLNAVKVKFKDDNLTKEINKIIDNLD